MLFLEVFRIALVALRANKLRSLLTMLGIVIGVGAVIAMDGIGRGAQSQIKARITSLGTTLLTVQAGQVRGMGGIASGSDRAKMTMADAAALEEQGTKITAVQPEMTRDLQIQFNSKNASTRVVGTSANYLEVRKYELEGGRMFTTQEDAGKQRLVVLGPAVLTNLGIENIEAIIGESVRVRGIQFTVIGVLKSKGQASAFGNPDDQILIPLNTARFRVLGTDRVGSISVLAQSEEMIPEAMADIQKILRRQHHLAREKDDDFNIRNQADFLTTAAETSKVFSSLLAGIASVSLLVGGIGIMNIMLVSVTERTREIGVRKALGATKLNILFQFLIEAVVLCLLGGAIGVLMGAGGGMAMTKFFNFKTEISSQSVVLAFAFSAAVGVIFGVWPARRAASLDPITALRYE
ncbi:MAG: ABC transporter permease [Gemmatimonadaceae bacterium]|nr:ABC transporter permease [Gemmatimonadaceae bacterium]